MDARPSLRLQTMRFIGGLTLGVLLVSGCTRDLERLQSADLLAVDPSVVPQGKRPELSADYAPDVTSPGGWILHGSLAKLAHLTDGDPATSAVTPADRGRDQWLLVDLGRPCRFQGVRQLHADGDGFPRRYRIDTAGPKGYPWTLQYVGEGRRDVSEALLRKPVEARFLRLTVLEEDEPRWGVAELELF